MKALKLTKEQENAIYRIQELGFKLDAKNSGFEKEFDGTYFYTFFAQHGMGVEMIQQDGTSEGNLLK